MGAISLPGQFVRWKWQSMQARSKMAATGAGTSTWTASLLPGGDVGFVLGGTHELNTGQHYRRYYEAPIYVFTIHRRC